MGDYEVTALFDGYNDLSPKLLKGMKPEEIRALLARHAIETPGVQTAFNAFLINTGKNLILVDTGAGQCIGETAGMLPQNIKAAGYQPEQVDTILLTHLHLDHVCGLVDVNKQPVFANATVYAAKPEADYWLDPTALNRVPEQAKAYFKIAQDSTAPYVAAGRFKTFNPGQSPVAEVRTTLEAGHTPGSTTYQFTSNGQSIVFIGDLVHNLAVQFEHPEVSIAFDENSKNAIASRDAVFSDAARRKVWVAAAHLPFPGLATSKPSASTSSGCRSSTALTSVRRTCPWSTNGATCQPSISREWSVGGAHKQDSTAVFLESGAGISTAVQADRRADR